ncbi:hypothetical protein HS125_14235 [bacterium]|nr:hypothetical protein [bacterium]
MRELETLFKRAGVWCDGEDILPEHFADAESALAVGDGDAAEAVLTLFCERERVSPREVRRLLG